MEEKIKAILNKLSLEELNDLKSLFDTDLDKVRSSMVELADEKYKQQEETKKKYEKYFKQRELYQQYILDSLKCKHPTQLLISSIKDIYPNEFRLGWIISPYYKAWYYKHNNSCIIPCDRNALRKRLLDDKERLVGSRNWESNKKCYDNILAKLESLPKLTNEEYPYPADPIDGFHFARYVYYEIPHDCRNNKERYCWDNITSIIFEYMIYDPSKEIQAPDYPITPIEMYKHNPEFIEDFKYD